VNGWDWLVSVQCGTCGAREEVQGPSEYVKTRRKEWLEEHDSHEVLMRQEIVRPESEANDPQLPEFMRVVPVS
jgi:hypothetical protein